MNLLTLGLIALLISSVCSIPIDNGVEGDPEIECGASAITVSFNTKNNFEGHVYVKGRFAEQGCRSDESGKKVAAITLPFTACGVERSRSLNPRGIFVSTTVVITFHPQFLTKVDRAYTLQCFYMEADKTVSQELQVSEITTLFQSQTIPMPICRYDILEGSPTGQPIKFAVIGQQVYHKWTCTTETTDVFCMVVHDCSVDDGAGNKANLLNENGCALDKFLLQNLEYSSDLMAGREAHVFKYADKAALFFQCQVTITIKEPGQQCPRPQCPEPGGIGGGLIGTLGVSGPPARPVAPKETQRPSGDSRTPAPVVVHQATPASQSIPSVVPALPGATNPAPTAGLGAEAPPRRTRPPGSGEEFTDRPEGGATQVSGYQGTAVPPGNSPPSSDGRPYAANGAPSSSVTNAQAPPVPIAPFTGAPPSDNVLPTFGYASGASVPGTAPPAPNPPPGSAAPPSYGGVATGLPPSQLRKLTNAPTEAGLVPTNPAPKNTADTSPQPGIPYQTPPTGIIYSEITSPVPNNPPAGSKAPPADSFRPVPTVYVAPVITNSPATPNPNVLTVEEAYKPAGTNAPPAQPSQPYSQPATAPVPADAPSTAPDKFPTAGQSYPQPATAAAPADSPAKAPSSGAPYLQPATTPGPLVNVFGGYVGDVPLPVDFELRKRKRALFDDEIGTADLRAQPIVIFDIDDESSQLEYINRSGNELRTMTSTAQGEESQFYCMTSASLGMFISFVVASTLTAVSFSFIFCMRKQKRV